MRERQACIEEGCQNAGVLRGYCNRHYQAAKRNGTFGAVQCAELGCDRNATTRKLCAYHYDAHRKAGEYGTATCLGPGCDRPGIARGMCASHYDQWSRGEELSFIYKNRGEWGPWSIDANGRAIRRRTVDGKRETQYRSRFVMEEILGRPLGKSERVRHLNGIADDDSPENLELM